jgi:hypothetical protein
MFVVFGASAPFLLGKALEPRNGLPPPNIHSFPPITAEPGTLIPVGRLARAVQVLAAMS